MGVAQIVLDDIVVGGELVGFLEIRNSFRKAFFIVGGNAQIVKLCGGSGVGGKCGEHNESRHRNPA